MCAALSGCECVEGLAPHPPLRGTFSPQAGRRISRGPRHSRALSRVSGRGWREAPGEGRTAPLRLLVELLVKQRQRSNLTVRSELKLHLLVQIVLGHCGERVEVVEKKSDAKDDDQSV